MRVYLICTTCMLHIAGCETVGVKGSSYCTLCKHESCLKRAKGINFLSHVAVTRGEFIPPNRYTNETCPECKDKKRPKEIWND